ncbi:DUF1343 domain-containing protein [Brumimicrobium salinarum]|uniref:DUF1343 domain-containing protein n=1 Tax=Brumimicrobium salinarum TaxID=2058658 RepID=A0A2I0R2A3_9FLAO|nr:DUF1343 domain-containing protein [Brumimicrobium salinarum]PKR80520.1 DUF1343 domain-containing protein [Brumimicrobium salinarum]
MYSLRLFLKSFFLIFLLSCKGNLPAQENDEVKVVEKVKKPLAKTIKVGAEQLNKVLALTEGRNVGVIANQTSRVGARHLVDTLLSLNVNLKTVFSPEHGFRGDADAGEHVSSDVDAKTGLPIVSLYGGNKKPKKEQLAGIDILLFDLQDVGTRFYTYISTLHYVMEAAAEQNLAVVVLDRPNPNGHYVDGPVRKEGFSSFVGMHPIPIVHGMTVGEIAKMINGEQWLRDSLKCSLEVIPCQNYSRDMQYSLPISPSPNLRSDAAIQLYPSLCLFEGTLMSVGRGTERPFEMFGHPALEDVDGFDFTFTPVSSYGAKSPKLENEQCYGKDLGRLVDSSRYHTLKIEWLIASYHALQREDFFITKNKWFDLLAGTDQLRLQIEAGKTAQEIRASWRPDLNAFKKTRKAYLLYD